MHKSIIFIIFDIDETYLHFQIALKMSFKRIGSKFLVLSWKNLLLKRRHWFMTILELVLPIILFILIAVLRLNFFSQYNQK